MKSKFKCVFYTHLPLLSCSYWNAASHSCGTFLFGHGFLHSLFKMMTSSLTARDWMATSSARTHLSDCCCRSMLWGISRIAQLMEPCRDWACAAPFWWLSTTSLCFSVCTTDMKGIQNLCHTRETHGIFLVTNTVVSLFAEGCKRWKGSLCITPYTCVQCKKKQQTNSLAVYIWKQFMTNGTSPVVMCQLIH